MAMRLPGRKRSARVVYNRRTHNALRVGIADGLLQVAEVIIEVADPPDATPYGEGLVTTGAAAAWVDGRKIGGQGARPRGLRLPKPGIVAVAEFGFPGRFQELGTITNPAQPFLTPATLAVTETAPYIIAPFVARRLQGLP